ncbi:hypothetical protein IAI10_10710 [Clostridium sp. 19966]|uniref:hypothetical protein n=1 Tax=Clostridium sp. 19966 TaxID=2768166 RepID=UPI0028DE2335|nr:hypothetical protein [Clostridium sp. 19966]MDT8717128.1 hypothetical protein [Clostridium sp. 19966]
MKKNLVLILCLSLIFILAGCSSDRKVANEKQTLESASQDASNQVQTSNQQSSGDEKKEAAPNAASSSQPAEINQSKQAVKDDNDASEKTTKVNGKVKLYAGTYFDSGVYGGKIKNDYCEIAISNITNTSFDFTVYEVKVNVSNGKKARKVIFLKNTAVFIGDGTKASFYGKNYNLNFTFPNYHNAYPIVTDMEVFGFQPLEGKDYVNNGIPGHEFG